jgi:hypothetical protein
MIASRTTIVEVTFGLLVMAGWSGNKFFTANQSCIH